MAATLISNLTAMINQVPLDEYINQYALDNTFLNFVGMEADPRGTWTHKVTTAANSGRGVTRTETTTYTADGVTRNKLAFSPAIFYVPFGASLLAKVRAAGGGLITSRDLDAEDVELNIMEIMDQVNDTMLSGSYSIANGINTLVDNSGSIGGVTRGTNAWADGYVNVASAPLSMSMMETVHTTLVDTRRKPYTQIWTSENVLKQYENLLKANNAFSVSPASYADTSFPSLHFRGRPVIAIPGYDNRMDFVNPANFSFKYVPVSVQDRHGRVVTGPFAISETSKTSNVDPLVLELFGDFVNKDPWGCGTIKSITSI